MRLAVVGHVEWVDFLVVSQLPGPGDIVPADAAFEAAAGGGAIAALALRALTGAATFVCAVGDDARGAATVAGLEAAGLDVRAAVRPRAQRRTVTWLTEDGERTITVLGEPLEPAAGDAGLAVLEDCDGVCFMAGDAAALRAARSARVVVASARARGALLEAGVAVDALVGSAADPGEALDDALLAATRPRWAVRTEGAAGGAWWAPADGTAGRWAPAPLPGPRVDACGCGDAFAPALMAGLAGGASPPAALDLAAAVGATLLTVRAPSVGDLAPLWSPRSTTWKRRPGGA